MKFQGYELPLVDNNENKTGIEKNIKLVQLECIPDYPCNIKLFRLQSSQNQFIQQTWENENKNMIFNFEKGPLECTSSVVPFHVLWHDSCEKYCGFDICCKFIMTLDVITTTEEDAITTLDETQVRYHQIRYHYPPQLDQSP